MPVQQAPAFLSSASMAKPVSSKNVNFHMFTLNKIMKKSAPDGLYSQAGNQVLHKNPHHLLRSRSGPHCQAELGKPPQFGQCQLFHFTAFYPGGGIMHR